MESTGRTSDISNDIDNATSLLSLQNERNVEKHILISLQQSVDELSQILGHKFTVLTTGIPLKSKHEGSYIS